MEDKVTEKVYCYDHPSAYKQDNSALWALAMGNHKENTPLETMALLNGGMNNWNNNPFMYMILMYMTRWLGNGYGYDGNGNGFATAETQRQIATLQHEMQDNHNSDLIMAGIKGNTDATREAATRIGCDLNALSSAISNVRAGIDTVAGQIGFTGERVINAVQAGDCNVIQALKDCCCQNKELVQRMGYENQLAQKDLLNAMGQQTLQLGERFTGIANGIQQGFSAVAYESQRQTCDIINSGKDNTQRIIDVLNNHWQSDLQQRYNDARLELSQKTQNEYLISQLKDKCC